MAARRVAKHGAPFAAARRGYLIKFAPTTRLVCATTQYAWKRSTSPPRDWIRRVVWRNSATLTLSANVSTAAENGPAIGELLKTGWQIAGYSQAYDNRSTFILFRHPEQSYLVQCRVGYDVTRTPSTYSICYKLQ